MAEQPWHQKRQTPQMALAELWLYRTPVLLALLGLVSQARTVFFPSCAV
ncbi:MAG: hypothetical protein ACUVRV_10930 [Cyanobacteriota bacterium]